MPTDLRQLMHEAAPVPRATLDVDGLLVRAHRHTAWRRWRRWLVPLAAIVAVGVPAEVVLAPAGPSHSTKVRIVNPNPAVTTTTALPAGTAAGDGRAGVAAGQAVSRTAPTVRGGTAPGAAGTSSAKPTATTAGPTQATARPMVLAFASSDGNIYVSNADGTGRKLLGPGLDPTWSPDGSKVLFWKGTGNTSGCDNDPGINQTPSVCTGDVWVMDADGSNAHLLISNGMKPDWSPDGRRIVYSAVQSTNSSHDLYVANADGSAPQQYVVGNTSGAKWSPDGSSIAFALSTPGTGPGEMDTIRADGTGRRAIWSSTDISSWAPAWSPDGTHIAFTAYNYGANNVTIWVLDLASGHGFPILSEPPSNSWVANMDYGPAWSPDGTRIAYSHDPDGASGMGNCDAGPTTGCVMGGPQPGTIYLVNPDGSAPAKVGEGAWPAFRPSLGR